MTSFTELNDFFTKPSPFFSSSRHSASSSSPKATSPTSLTSPTTTSSSSSNSISPKHPSRTNSLVINCIPQKYRSKSFTGVPHSYRSRLYQNHQHNQHHYNQHNQQYQHHQSNMTQANKQDRRKNIDMEDFKKRSLSVDYEYLKKKQVDNNDNSSNNNESRTLISSIHNKIHNQYIPNSLKVISSISPLSHNNKFSQSSIRKNDGSSINYIDHNISEYNNNNYIGNDDDDYIINTPKTKELVENQESTIKRTTSFLSINLSPTDDDEDDDDDEEDEDEDEDEEYGEDDSYSCLNDTITTPVIQQEDQFHSQSQVSLHSLNSAFKDKSPLSTHQKQTKETLKLKNSYNFSNPTHLIPKKSKPHHHHNNKLYRTTSLKRYNSNTSTTSTGNNSSQNCNIFSIPSIHKTTSASTNTTTDHASSSSLNLNTLFTSTNQLSNNTAMASGSSNTRVCELIRSNSQVKKSTAASTPTCVTPSTVGFPTSVNSFSSTVSTPGSMDPYTPVTPERNNLLYKINTDHFFEMSSTTSFTTAITDCSKSNSIGEPDSTIIHDQGISQQTGNGNENVAENDASDEDREYCSNGIPYITCEEFAKKFTTGKQNMIVVDCRFEEEYQGGHIINSVNIDDHINMKNFFFSTSSNNFGGNDIFRERNPFFQRSDSCDKKSSETIVVLYCEYTKYRSPTLAQFIRRFDRNLNLEYYPELYYPNLYILKGGFYDFYGKYPKLCLGEYKPMLESDQYEDKLDYFRSKSGLLLHSEHSSEVMLNMKLECVKTLENDVRNSTTTVNNKNNVQHTDFTRKSMYMNDSESPSSLLDKSSPRNNDDDDDTDTSYTHFEFNNTNDMNFKIQETSL